MKAGDADGAGDTDVEPSEDTDPAAEEETSATEGTSRRGERTERLDHLRDVPDGCGCAEVWEHLSERATEE